MLKIIAAISSLFILIVVSNYYYNASSNNSPKLNQQLAQTLPWQINTYEDTIQVFSIILGHTSLQEAIDTFGSDYEIAVIVPKQQTGSLELFYSRFNSGPLSGKMILVADADDNHIQQLRQYATSKSYIETGSQKIKLNEEQASLALPLKIKALTFAPIARLNKDLVIERFGPPAEIIQSSEFVSQLLYPEQGLLIIINDKGKDFLEYTQPSNFQQLIKEIRNRKEENK